MITKQLEAALTLGPLTQLLRLRDVLAITLLEKTHVYRLMAIGEFPKPRKIGPRTRRWTLDSIQAWMADNPEARDTSIAKHLDTFVTFGQLTQMLRLPDVLEIINLERSHVYRLIAAGKFPKPRKIGPRTRRWTLDSILPWIDSLPEASYPANQKTRNRHPHGTGTLVSN